MRKKWMALGLAGLLAVSMPVTSLASALTLSEQECLEEETVSELTEEEEIDGLDMHEHGAPAYANFNLHRDR